MTHMNEKFVAMYTCSPSSYSLETHFVGVFSSEKEAERALDPYRTIRGFSSEITDVIEGVPMDEMISICYE